MKRFKLIKLETTEKALSDISEIQKIIKAYFEKFYFNKLWNLEEMKKFQDTYDLPKLSQEEINNLLCNKQWDCQSYLSIAGINWWPKFPWGWKEFSGYRWGIRRQGHQAGTTEERLLWLAQLAYTSQRLALPSMEWAIPHQLLIKKMPPQTWVQATVVETISQLRLPFPWWLYFGSS